MPTPVRVVERRGEQIERRRMADRAERDQRFVTDHGHVVAAGELKETLGAGRTCGVGEHGDRGAAFSHGAVVAAVVVDGTAIVE